MEKTVERTTLLVGAAGAVVTACAAAFGTQAAISALVVAIAVCIVEHLYARGVVRILNTPGKPAAAIRLQMWRMLGLLLALALGIELLSAFSEPVGAAILAAFAIPILSGRIAMHRALSRKQ